MTPTGVRPLWLLALPLLAVSVSIGAVMPSAPFDGWSPPPSLTVHAGRAPGPSGAAKGQGRAGGERALPAAMRSRRRELLDGPRRPVEGRLAAAVAALLAAVLLAAATGAASARGGPGRRRSSDEPGPSVRWWTGAATRPHRAPPRLRTA